MARHCRIADHEVCGSEIFFPVLPQHVGNLTVTGGTAPPTIRAARVGHREVRQVVQRSGELLGRAEVGHGDLRAALGQEPGHAHAAAVDTQPHHERAPAAIIHRTAPLRRPLGLHGRPPPRAISVPKPGRIKFLVR